jgi:hypothetical protein
VNRQLNNDACAVVAGAIAGAMMLLGFRTIGTLNAPILFVLAGGIVMSVPKRGRRTALVIAVGSAGIGRGCMLFLDPAYDSVWLGVLALESIIAGAVALRWPLWGLAMMAASTALHRWRVVDMDWRPAEVPLAALYAAVAVVLLAVAVSGRSRQA